MLKKIIAVMGIALTLTATAPLAQEASSPKYMMRFGTNKDLLPEQGSVTTPGGPTTPTTPSNQLAITFPDIIVDSSTAVKTFKAIVSGVNNPNADLEYKFGFTYPAADSNSSYDKSKGWFYAAFNRTAAQGDYDSNNYANKPFVEVKDLNTGDTARTEFRIWIKAAPAVGDQWTVTYPDVYATVGQEIWMPRKPIVKKNGEDTAYGTARFYTSNTPPGTSGALNEIIGVPTAAGVYTVTITVQSGSGSQVPNGLGGTFKVYVEAQEPAFRYFKIAKSGTNVGLQPYMSEVSFLDNTGTRIPKWSGADYPAISNQFLYPRNDLGNGLNTPQEVMLCLKADCSGPFNSTVDFVFDFGPSKARPKVIEIREPQPSGYTGHQPFFTSYSGNNNYAATVWGSDDGVTWSYISAKGSAEPSTFYGKTTIYLNGFKFF
jgi:hypothetical protein|nr:hypothetical protein [Neorhizobium tomejilense]